MSDKRQRPVIIGCFQVRRAWEVAVGGGGGYPGSESAAVCLPHAVMACWGLERGDIPETC